jgi:transposase
MGYELSDNEWTTIGPMLPNKARGVPRVDDRRVLNGIFWVLRSGAPWRDLPSAFGPYTTSLEPLCALATRRGLEPDHGRARRCP